jgi:hypothetical protein
MQIGNQNYPWVDSVLGFKIPEHDSIDLTYSGDHIATVTYKKAGVVVRVLTLTYISGKLSNITQTA